MNPLVKRAALLGTAAVAISACWLSSASAPVFASASTSSATSSPVATRQSSSTGNQYTRYTFDMTGSWKMVSTGSVAVDPGAGANTFYTRFTRIDNLSPIANDPVYEGDVFGQNCEYAGNSSRRPT